MLITILTVLGGLGAGSVLTVGALYAWPKTENPVVLRMGDPVLVRLDPDVNVWTPGTLLGFSERKKSNDYYARGYRVTLSDGSEWHVMGQHIRPDTGRRDTKPREPEGYR